MNIELRNTQYEIRDTRYERSLPKPTTKDYVRNYKQNMQNKPNFQKSQMNVSSVITMNYEQRTMNDELKNKPNSKPIQSQFKPNTKPIQTQYKANSNPTCRGVASGEAGTNPILHSPRPNPSRKYVAGFLRVFYAVLTVFGSPDKEWVFSRKVSNEQIDWLVICGSIGLGADGIFVLLLSI